MSAFYDLASLVLVPSGYKTSKVYAQKPLTTDGQLAFTRASTATRVGPDGLIEKVRTNFILQSEAFNTTWGATGVSVTPNTTANPLNGALNADTITLSAGTSGKNVSQNFSQNGVFTQSVFLKAGTHQFVQLLIGDDVTPRANFDLVNGTATATSSTASIVSVGNGWFRCSMSYTTPNGSVVYLWAVDSLAAARAASTASTGTFFAFGFQLETGDIATPYIPTTTAAVSVGMLANVPRLDYTGGGCPKLLLEPQRVNLMVQSKNLNTSWTPIRAIATSNAATSPDGFVGADKIIADTDTNTTHLFFQNKTSLAAGTYAYSAFFKKGEYEFGAVRIATDSDTKRFGAVVNLNTGAITATNSFGSPTGTSTKVEEYANGWYRLIVTCAHASGDVLAATTLSPTAVPTFSNSLPSFTGNNTSGVFTWGAQLELGSYATSYIPTLGAAVTRSADAASKTGISALIGQTAGTIYAEVDSLTNADNSRAIAIQGGGSRMGITISSTEVGYFVVTSAGVIINTSFAQTAATKKVSLAYQSGSTALFCNGVLVNSDATTYTLSGALAELYLGQFEFAVGTGQNAQRNAQTLVFKTRLTNAQCIELTA